MSENIFNKIQIFRPQYSWFDMSYDHKTSIKMGELVPIHVQEHVPGDTIHMSSEAMFRMMPMIAPIMHKVEVFIHHFFVPNRILWPNWEEWITGGENGGAGIPIAFPVMINDNLNVTPSSLANYLGLPIKDFTGSNTPISALPFAAYHRIWFEWYRDQNLQLPEEYKPPMLRDGEQTPPFNSRLMFMMKRAWEHDYFTSALPFAQKGEAVEIPLDMQGSINITQDMTVQQSVKLNTGSATPPSAGPADLYVGLTPPGVLWDNTNNRAVNLKVDDSLEAEFGDDVTTSTTVNDLRVAISLQKWLEKNARGGTRYNESIFAHYGVKTKDARLQRPEYLGGSRATMSISEVLQTSSTSDTPQGNMAGHGISVTGGRDFKYFVHEHGYVMSILSVRPKTAYMQGIPKHFMKNDRTQILWPDFAFLGEQPITNAELYFTGVDDVDKQTFGYTPRYAEYRYNSSRVSGQMATSELDFWHMGRKFETPPGLNYEFIECDPTKRIFAVEAEEEDEIVAHIYHKMMVRRPLPKYGNPGSL